MKALRAVYVTIINAGWWAVLFMIVVNPTDLANWPWWVRAAWVFMLCNRRFFIAATSHIFNKRLAV